MAPNLNIACRFSSNLKGREPVGKEPSVCTSIFGNEERFTDQPTGIAHADRRPVDPPPVVELRLFEGHEKTDV